MWPCKMDNYLQNIHRRLWKIYKCLKDKNNELVLSVIDFMISINPQGRCPHAVLDSISKSAK